ncbi:MAG: dihydroorotate dehydrogenase electron transfer subunit [Patescibacteria group bacterium]
MPLDHVALVRAKKEYGQDAYRLDLEAPALAAAFMPGQFVMAEIPGAGFDPMLRRPLGCFGVDAAAGRLSLLVQRVGRGTRLLGGMEAGQKMMILGPLGRGWTIPERGPVLIVAGGVGIVPLYDLAAACAARVETVVVYGARCREGLYLVEDLARLPLGLIPATEDGSLGWRGTAVGALEGLEPARFIRYYGCGPRPMLAGLRARMAAVGVEGELSLEERMACGFGACLGCAVAVQSPDGGAAYKRVCTDGPVFPAGEVLFT